MTFVIIPGLDGSDDHHWQSRWESDWLVNAVRIRPSSWSAPDLSDWSQAITTAVESISDDIVFITHSLGCHAVTHWLTTEVVPARIRGAFMVAPPDPLADTFPVDRLPTFASLPTLALPVPAVLTVSTDDPYCTVDGAARLAAGWTTPLIALDDLGHINTDSKLDLWPQGQHLLTAFLGGLGVVPDKN